LCRSRLIVSRTAPKPPRWPASLSSPPALVRSTEPGQVLSPSGACRTSRRRVDIEFWCKLPPGDVPFSLPDRSPHRPAARWEDQGRSPGGRLPSLDSTLIMPSLSQASTVPDLDQSVILQGVGSTTSRRRGQDRIMLSGARPRLSSRQAIGHPTIRVTMSRIVNCTSLSGMNHRASLRPAFCFFPMLGLTFHS
jgi:hypothetical protein